MAGFFMLLGDILDENNKVISTASEILCDLCRYGIYSTNLHVNKDSDRWSKQKISVFTDYLSMREGDYIFFFTNRKIYGVGKLVKVGDSCVHWAFKGANKPIAYSEKNITRTKLFNTILPDNRCVCFFKPLQYFKHAIDMDEALTSYPDSFKSLRVIEGRSFIKMDDEEATALFSVMSKRNSTDSESNEADWIPPVFDDSKHKLALKRIKANKSYYEFNTASFLSDFSVIDNDMISEEMAIEAALVECLNKNTNKILGEVSYVSHQVTASPAKPVGYMELMDVFGYTTSKFLIENAVPIQFSINQFFVAEVKRGTLYLEYSRKKEPKYVRDNKAAANQLMKYVDWIANNYASGKYPMVKGILVANDFDAKFIDYCRKLCVRNYNDGYRNPTPSIWNKIILLKYSFDGAHIKFKNVPLE